ncbi:hypothetical protein [Lysobacter silvisoli]|uniref:ORC-CDC6 family AAA ATPase n=1 Tax=Lysobacter silvisoli TaxID=2293254 RepID=UPI0011C036CE|nr:hypothetical protein [Lysobacter silvisoli]
MTSDNDFVRLFSPKIVERLEDDTFEGGVHILRSSPGGGKTTLLRAFTPPALNAFWSARKTPDLADSYQRLVARGVLDQSHGPQLLGVLLSCAAGYADLPPGADIEQDTLFRALLDCRVVLRAVRSIGLLAGLGPDDDLAQITLSYDPSVADLRGIPLLRDAAQMARWAEEVEQNVYTSLDSFRKPDDSSMPAHFRFESVLWLQAVAFEFQGRALAPKRLLMIDDVQRLRKKQRDLLIDELTVLRPSIPVWLSERTIAMGDDDLLSQGVRDGREIRHYNLEEMWSLSKGGAQSFVGFAQNILDRRMKRQDTVASSAFSQCLRTEFNAQEIRSIFDKAVSQYTESSSRLRGRARYEGWLAKADRLTEDPSWESLLDLYSIQILLSRDEKRRQMTLDLSLSDEELEERDSSQVRGAAELFASQGAGLPYYFGLDRLCAMASSNVDELLFLASELYVGLQARQAVRKPDLILSPSDQEKLLKAAAKKKRNFIPRNHSRGSNAQRLLDAVGAFCKDKTFAPNAPYAPGVTGVRLSQQELHRLNNPRPSVGQSGMALRKVIAECVAENLLIIRNSSASTSRDSGQVFYLNRTLCAHYDLPLQFGGWQDVTVVNLEEWMNLGVVQTRRRRLESL